MVNQTIALPFCQLVPAAVRPLMIATTMFALFAVSQRVCAEGTETKPATPSKIQVIDPFEPLEPETDPFELQLSDSPVDAAAYVPARTRFTADQANFQGPAISKPEEELPSGTQPTSPTADEPCAAARFKPLREIGIGIQQPDGKSPTNFAAACWEQINAGPNGICRCWPVLNYNWEPTCLCHNPLYFEEINAERYGYICNDCCCCCGPGNCMQSAASAAHFFGTIPCLPYCLSAQCPTECVYTLGHYRPGSCPPWRWHWPRCDPYAAATCAGVYTGLIFAIP